MDSHFIPVGDDAVRVILQPLRPRLHSRVAGLVSMRSRRPWPPASEANARPQAVPVERPWGRRLVARLTTLGERLPQPSRRVYCLGGTLVVPRYEAVIGQGQQREPSRSSSASDASQREPRRTRV